MYNSAKNGQVTEAPTCLVPKNSIDQQERRVTASPNLIGARLGVYDVQAVIGSGGMASVYRALDPNLQLDQLRTLLVNGVTDGQISTGGDALIAKLDAAQSALAQNDTETATAQLQALQLLLISGARSGTIAPEMLRQTLTGVDAVAHSAGLTLPFSVTSG